MNGAIAQIHALPGFSFSPAQIAVPAPPPCPCPPRTRALTQPKVNQACHAVTIRQVLTAEKVDEAWKVDGEEVSTVVVVGCIFEIAEKSTSIGYKITDGSGSIDILIHILTNLSFLWKLRRSLFRHSYPWLQSVVGYCFAYVVTYTHRENSTNKNGSLNSESSFWKPIRQKRTFHKRKKNHPNSVV